MTKAQRVVVLNTLYEEYKYNQRQYRLAVIRDFNVKFEVTKTTRECTINGKLVICVINDKLADQEWFYSVRTMFDTLIAVKSY